MEVQGTTPPQGVQAAPAARFLSTFQTGRHYRVHKSYIYLGPATVVAVVVAVTFLNGIQGFAELIWAVRDGSLPIGVPQLVGLALLGIVVLFGLMVGIYALAWRNMSYVFDEREFSYYSGIITKRRVHVPYARVQSVNHRATILQRIAGVCSVTVDSAGGAANKGVRVPYLRLETAERLREELFMRKVALEVGAVLAYDAAADSSSDEGTRAEAERERRRRAQAPVAPVSQGVAAGAAPQQAQTGAWACPRCGEQNGPSARFCPECGEAAPARFANVLDEVGAPVADWRGLYGGAAAFGAEEPSFEYGLTNRELLFVGLSHDTPLGVALTVGFSVLVTFAFILLVQDEVALFLTGIALVSVIGLTLFTWAVGLLSVMVSYGNFRARRRGARIEVERGLLSREFSGIDIDRVQSVEVRQSLIRRCIGYCEVSLGRIDVGPDNSSGESNSKSNGRGLVVHPFVRLDQVDQIIDGLAPELADRPRRVECQPLPAVALRRALLRRCIWYNWTLLAPIFVAVCWGVVSHFADARSIAFANEMARAQYDSFMASSLTLVLAFCIAATVVRGVGAVLWARHSGFAWNRNYLMLHNDGLVTSQVVVPRQKIQAAATRSNPFQRRLALATVQAVTAAGRRNTTVKLVDVPAESAAAYLDWIKPRTAPDRAYPDADVQS